jgi:hypothetical protein
VEEKRRKNMYKRILTSLTVPFVLAGAVATGTATARQLQEIGAPAAPSSSTQTEVAGQSQKAIIREKLQEIGAWAVPSSTQTEVVPKPLVSEKLSGLGLPTTTTVASGGEGFDWNDAGIGAAFVFGITLVGAASLVTIRRHHGPAVHN